MSCVIAGIMASFLPETLNENLPQTIFDAEEFGKHQKFFSCNRRRRSISRERAASLIKVKALENVLTCDEKDANLHQAVTVLQNNDLIPNGDNYVVMTEPEKVLNDRSDSLRNRKNSQYITKDLSTAAAQFQVSSSESNEGHTHTSEPSQKDQCDVNRSEELEETIPPENEDSEERRKLPVDASADNKPFAYVNAVFYNNEEDSHRQNEQNECRQNSSPTGTLEKKRNVSALETDTKMQVLPTESQTESH
ncbi:uncharacterized protein LOC118196146 [Stegodyphus dumicola]|uniref:uncharacterized protein LOC118196146 n=1 Tax=Stegodyphus dumicola TaxID=202533 RepID=UPI0015AC0E7E|nr:uncharacterized protein LOC118196146 [Stegodyphus dumicola]